MLPTVFCKNKWGAWFNPYHGVELYPDKRCKNFKKEREDHGGFWRGNENGILFLTEWVVLSLKRSYKEKDYKKVRKEIIKLLDGLTVRRKKDNGEVVVFNGLYDRGKEESFRFPEYARSQSHDNYTAIAVLSFLLKLEHHKHIYNRMKWGRLDNRYANNQRISRTMPPRDTIFYAWLVKKWWGKLLLSISLLFSFLPILTMRWNSRGDIVNSSTVLLSWLRFHCFPEKGWGQLVRRVADWLVERKVGGWKAVFANYFKCKEHPNRNFNEDVYLLYRKAIK